MTEALNTLDQYLAQIQLYIQERQRQHDQSLQEVQAQRSRIAQEQERLDDAIAEWRQCDGERNACWRLVLAERSRAEALQIRASLEQRKKDAEQTIAWAQGLRENLDETRRRLTKGSQ